MVPPRICLLLFLISSLALSWTASAQIYADVTVSGAVSGTFTISLEYEKAPAAVANFIGLATGKKAWLDQNTGSLRNDPFYNGVTFHRVIAGFMSQTGSRNGNGTDGPGYTFRNEIDPTLTHNTPYTVAMANSGKDTNGSQWFLRAGVWNYNGLPTDLDGSYTIFGVVTSGTAVCDALNSVPTTGPSGSPKDKPLTPVTISSINISGPSLASFNLDQNALPKVLSARPVMKVSGSTYSLGYDHQPYSDYYVYDSADLASRSRFASGYFHSVAPLGDVDVTGVSTGSKHFFRFARVDYSTARTSPASLAGKTLTFPALFGTTLIISAAGSGGTYTYTGFGGGSGALTTFSYSPQAYTGTIYTAWDNNVQMAFDRLDYTSSTGGTFVARTNVTGYSNVSGTFTSAP